MRNRLNFHTLCVMICLLLSVTATSITTAAEVTVSAAASLADAFRDINQAYEKAAPQQKIWLNTAASGALLQQMENGAPVDVFASADEDTMTSAVKAGLVNATAPTVFARNSLVVIVPIDSKTSISTALDLNSPQLKRIALGNPATVPAGHYGTLALKKAGVWAGLQGRFILAENVRQAMAYVARGEVNAGIVYATDAKLMVDKVKVAFELPSAIPVQYYIAPTANAKNAAVAAKYVRFIMSPQSQDILAKYGFGRTE